jgi:hypothetical protein
MMSDRYLAGARRQTRGPSVLDIGIIAAIKLYDPAELPDTLLITAVTLGELSYGRMRLTIR